MFISWAKYQMQIGKTIWTEFYKKEILYLAHLGNDVCPISFPLQIVAFVNEQEIVISYREIQ